jgi:hypothetical protein
MRYSLFVFSAGPVWFSPESCGRRLLFIVPIDSRGAGQQHRTLLAARRFCLLLLIFGTGQSRSCFRAQGSLVFVTAPGFGVSGRRSCCVICVLAGSAPALIWSLWISGFISPCSAHSQHQGSAFAALRVFRSYSSEVDSVLWMELVVVLVQVCCWN